MGKGGSEKLRCLLFEGKICPSAVEAGGVKATDHLVQLQSVCWEAMLSLWMGNMPEAHISISSVRFGITWTFFKISLQTKLKHTKTLLRNMLALWSQPECHKNVFKKWLSLVAVPKAAAYWWNMFF